MALQIPGGDIRGERQPDNAAVLNAQAFRRFRRQEGFSAPGRPHKKKESFRPAVIGKAGFLAVQEIFHPLSGGFLPDDSLPKPRACLLCPAQIKVFHPGNRPVRIRLQDGPSLFAEAGNGTRPLEQPQAPGRLGHFGEVFFPQMQHIAEHFLRNGHLQFPSVHGTFSGKKLHHGIPVRLPDVNLLETALQRPVLLDIHPVLVVGGRQDHRNPPPGHKGLQDVSDTVGASRGELVGFVHEKDDLSAGVHFRFLPEGVNNLLHCARNAAAALQPVHVDFDDDRPPEFLPGGSILDQGRQFAKEGRLSHAGPADKDSVPVLGGIQHGQKVFHLGSAG